MNGVPSTWRKALALKWLWLIHTYSFNWAHKPLCARFSHDVVCLGHIHLCRSCLLAYVGIAVSSAMWFWNPLWLQTHGEFTFVVVAMTAILLSLPFWYKRWPRPVRDILRFCMGLTIPMCGYLAVNGHLVVGIAGGLALFGFWRVYLALRRRRRLHSCDGCSEFGIQGICSGYQQQAACLRVYEQKATEWVIANEIPISKS